MRKVQIPLVHKSIASTQRYKYLPSRDAQTEIFGIYSSVQEHDCSEYEGAIVV